MFENVLTIQNVFKFRIPENQINFMPTYFCSKKYFKSWSNSVITNFKEQLVFNYESDFELTSDIRE